MFKSLVARVALALLLFAPLAAFSADHCGAPDEAALKTCKSVKFKGLPADLRKFMAKSKCDVKTGSNYDYGYAVELNSDGQPEYAFCCREAKHGPCGMAIFSKSAQAWKIIADDLYFSADDAIPCDGLVVLKDKTSGHNDLCLDEGSTILRLRNGMYQ